MVQERCREASISKSQLAGWGTSHELAALHKMPHDSELFQKILKGLPFNMDWDEEDHLTLLFDALLLKGERRPMFFTISSCGG
jgi:hypothetical protein